jgi:3-oxoacyl-[acyl-carrier protein] reductase
MLKNKTAVVTGASRGIGKAIAIMLSAQGANVVLNYRNGAVAVEEVVKEIQQNGGSAIAVQGDVSNFQDAGRLMKTAVDHFGSVDLLINNAGITKDTLLLRMSEEDFDTVINVNLKGAFNCIKHASAIMLKQKSGKIINISSVIGVVGNIGQSNYAAAKAGIIGFTKSCAKELASRGITVNAIAPGFIQTDMTDGLNEKTKETILSNIPLKKLGTPEDVAHMVCFLSSEGANYITGQVFHVDGGMVM